MNALLQFEKFSKNIVNIKFFIILLLVLIFSYYFLDQRIAYALFTYKNSTFYHINDFLTKLGYGLYYIVGLTIGYLFSYFVLKKKTLANSLLFILLAIIISGIICDILKVLLGRARPGELLDNGVYGFKFLQTSAKMWSFPSGHATTITSIVLPLIIFFPRYWLGLLIILLVISFTRVFINAHFFSDTIAGIYLATVTVYWLFKWFKRKNWLAFT